MPRTKHHNLGKTIHILIDKIFKNRENFAKYFFAFPIFRFSDFPIFRDFPRFSDFPIFQFPHFPIFRFSHYPIFRFLISLIYHSKNFGPRSYLYCSFYEFVAEPYCVTLSKMAQITVGCCGWHGRWYDVWWHANDEKDDFTVDDAEP